MALALATVVTFTAAGCGSSSTGSSDAGKGNGYGTFGGAELPHGRGRFFGKDKDVLVPVFVFAHAAGKVNSNDSSFVRFLKPDANFVIA